MLGLVPLLLASSGALAQEPAPALPGQGRTISAGAEIAASSRYVWRGMPASGGPALQPSAWLGYENVSLAAWGNLPLDPADGRGLNELDLVLSVSQEWESLSFEPGLVAYLLPGVGFTAEAFGDLSWQPSWFGLYSNHAIDFWDARPSWWSESGLLVSAGLPARLGLDAMLGLSLANRDYNLYYLGLDRAGSQYLCGGLSLSWSHGSGLYAGLSGRADWLVPAARETFDEGPVLMSALLTLGWEGSMLRSGGA
jgi:hypothetical protein